MTPPIRTLAALAAALLLAGCAITPPTVDAVPSRRPTAAPAASANSRLDVPRPDAAASASASATPLIQDPTSPIQPSAPPEQPPAPPGAQPSTPPSQPVKPGMGAPTGPSTPSAPGRTGTGSGPKHGDAIVLSFDDCPPSDAEFRSTILAAERLGIALALFPTGTCLAKGYFSVDFARSHGHYVFNHSATHADLTKLTKQQVITELGPPGVQANWGRPPFGAVNDVVRSGYAAKGMRIWMWDLDTNDWRGKSADELVAFVATHARASDTILMHMSWHAFNGDVLGRMKASLVGRGLSVCRNLGPTDVSPTVRC